VSLSVHPTLLNLLTLPKERKAGGCRWTKPINRSCYSGGQISRVCFPRRVPVLKVKIAKSRKVIVDKVDAGLSVYGVSTGFGGSADTRTDEPILLGNALLQHQHSGVLPSSTKPLNVLPLQDPLSTTSMPEAWVRGAILIRMNSLIRGHSGVRWELIEKMNELLRANVTPLVPLRGTISASGGMYYFISLSITPSNLHHR
jgi:histidine ammonia-lyase